MPLGDSGGTGLANGWLYKISSVVGDHLGAGLAGGPEESPEAFESVGWPTAYFQIKSFGWLDSLLTGRPVV